MPKGRSIIIAEFYLADVGTIPFLGGSPSSYDRRSSSQPSDKFVLAGPAHAK